MKRKLIIIIILSIGVNFAYGYNIRDILNLKRISYKSNRNVGSIKVGENDKITGTVNYFVQGLQDNNYLMVKELLADNPTINNKKTDKIHCMSKIKDEIRNTFGPDKSELMKEKLMPMGKVGIDKSREIYKGKCLFMCGEKKIIFELILKKIHNNYKIIGITILRTPLEEEEKI